MVDFFEKLNNISFFAQSTVVMCYVSTKNEIDTHSLIQQLLDAGKKVAVPKTGENFNMDFYYISSLCDLTEGRYGIKEPVVSTENFFNPSSYDNIFPIPVVVPGTRFDIKRNRKGHGAGYYDRFFGRYGPDRFYKIALCREDQLSEALDNVKPHDVTMDLIITDCGRII